MNEPPIRHTFFMLASWIGAGTQRHQVVRWILRRRSRPTPIKRRKARRYDLKLRWIFGLTADPS
jgi:hypothetical protein